MINNDDNKVSIHHSMIKKSIINQTKEKHAPKNSYI
jgi:hypothetical protein